MLLRWAELWGERGGEGVTLHDEHVSVTERSGPMGIFESEREVAHVFSPGHRPDVCRLCHGQKTAATPYLAPGDETLEGSESDS